MSDESLVIDDTASVVPPPPSATAQPGMYVMAAGELFTRDQYIAAGWTDKQLLDARKMHAIAPPPKEGELAAPLGMMPSKWIILDDNDDIPPTGLFIGWNGNSFLVQTGIPLKCPIPVLNVLDDAVMSTPVTDPKTRQVVGYRDRPRYTYREVSAPADA